MDTPDEWLSKMITTGFNEKSPEWMRGAGKTQQQMVGISYLDVPDRK